MKMKYCLTLTLALSLAANAFADDAGAAKSITSDTPVATSKDSAPSYTMTPDTNAPTEELKMWQEQFGATHDQRMQWFRQARFGMFIHWGVYSVPAGAWNGTNVVRSGAEWIMNRGRIPVADYQKLPAEFNPTNFNAREWVKIAKKAGMKYIVITAKHHDGFAMYHSQASGFNIYDATPFKRDPLKELAAACKKEGIKLGFYYSQSQDWNHPGGGASGGHWDKAQDGSADEFVDQVDVPQIRELLTNYGEVCEFWFDTPARDIMSPERVARIMPLLKLQPNMVVNNRLDARKRTGDFQTPENKIPPTGIPGVDWETCMTMNKTWGFRASDTNWKSGEMLITNLVDITSKGGNYLLNVGPTRLGEIPEASVERLAEVGKWMKVNGDAIYGTTASPFPTQLAWGRCTKKVHGSSATLYLHVFNWPNDGKLIVPAMEGKVQSAKMLVSGQKLTSSVSPNGELVLSLPATAPDKISSTIKLEIKGF
ncbi:MAG TPA: alpha-L-fucosidase, partial [Desulfuromonadaceae bacterium]|nr:alpha-L-fucosidase [Desulfuromonadaceae bacterium]